MPEPLLQATVRTTRFNYTEVKPHFINPCCFGEDFAAWLQAEIADLATHGFELSEPIQEDYGWGIWASRGKDTFWIAIASVQDDGDGEPQATEGEWIVAVNYDPGLDLFKRMFHRADPEAGFRVTERVRSALERAPDIRIVDMDDTGETAR